MDGNRLPDSARILLLHLTNVLNSEMEFSNREMRRIESTGGLPHLVRCGSAELTLESTLAGLKVFALTSSGKRLREVPSSFQNGEYRFTVSVTDAATEPALAYELARP